MYDDKVKAIREKYPAGTRIRLLKMDDPQSPAPKTLGTVVSVDSIGSIQMRWDSGGSLALIPGEDEFEIVSKTVWDEFPITVPDTDIKLTPAQADEIHRQYEAHCTAEYIADVYKLSNKEALDYGFEIRMLMDKYDYDESTAIDEVLQEREDDSEGGPVC